MGFFQAAHLRRVVHSTVFRTAFADGLPLHTIFAWRPALTLGQDKDIQVFHDGPANAVVTEASDRGLRLAEFSAIRSFASIAIPLPHHVRGALDARHILRLDATLRLSRPLQGYTRLNLRHGPDTDAITRGMRLESGRCVTEFDLVTTGVGRRPLHHAWIDVIFDNPQGAEIVAEDLLVTCRPRAEC